MEEHLSRVVTIKPSHKDEILHDLLHDIKPQGARIVSVSINLEERLVEVRLCSPERLSEEHITRLCVALSDKFGHEQCEVRVKWLQEQHVSLDQLLIERIDQIREAVFQAVPSLSGWAKHIEFRAHGECLEILVPNETAVAAASRRRFRDALCKSVSDCLDRSVAVRIKLGTMKCEEEEIEHQEADCLLEPIEDVPVKSVEHSPVLLGRPINKPPTPVREVSEPKKAVVVEGEVFGVELRALKRGGMLLCFNLTDYEDSIAVKVIAKQEAVCIEESDWVRLRGDAAVDRYSEELTITARDIMKVAKPVRLDEEPEKRVELHLHTRMSSMDSVLDLKEAIRRAKSWGHDAIAVTDHGVVQAFPQAHDLALENGIKLIYGVEGYLVDSDDPHETPFHIVLLALDGTGLLQLYTLVTESHIDHFYKKPRILRKRLCENRSNLLLGSACEAGEVFRKVLQRAPQDELESVARFYDYLEIQPRQNNCFLIDGTRVTEQDIEQFNIRILETGDSLGIPVIAACDVHFLDPEDAIYREVLLVAQGYDAGEQDSPLYFRTTREMLDEFSYLGEDAAKRVVIDAPRSIANKVASIAPVPTGFFAPEVPGAQRELETIARREAHALYGETLPDEVEERLERELNSITRGGFAGIFMIARELVAKSERDGYLVGSRGSVGSSFVARLVGITEVNPLPPHYRCTSCRLSDFERKDTVDSGFDLEPRPCPKCGSILERDGHNIAYEVFMGFYGEKVPDIDLNFSGENQASVIKFTEELLGKGHVFRAGTIATVAERTAFGLVKAYCEGSGRRIRKAEAARLARGITGVKRTTGQHPGGVLILPEGKQILEFTPLQHPADDRKSGTITTHFDYDSISSRLVKLDILGHDDPSALRMLADATGIDPRGISFSDQQTMSIFSSTRALGYRPEDIGCAVGTLGIPEFGTRFVRQMLSETRPKDFSDLVRISGLSHGTGVWLDNAQELIRSEKALLKDVICARDDIMNYLIKKAMPSDAAFKIMENVRKGRGISADEESLMRKAGVPAWYVDSCRKIQYLFPKAHATAYVMMAFRIAFFKVHAPLAFYTQYLTLRSQDVDLATLLAGPGAIMSRLSEAERAGQSQTQREKDQATVLEVAYEMYLRGITVRGVSLYESDALEYKVVGNTLLAPFVSLSGMGATAARSLVDAREAGPFTSVEDLRLRTRLQRNLIDLLRQFGCLQDLAEHNQMALI